MTNIDNMTTLFVCWAALVALAAVALQACGGCCIAKLLGKPCRKK